MSVALFEFRKTLIPKRGSRILRLLRFLAAMLSHRQHMRPPPQIKIRIRRGKPIKMRPADGGKQQRIRLRGNNAMKTWINVHETSSTLQGGFEDWILYPVFCSPSCLISNRRLCPRLQQHPNRLSGSSSEQWCPAIYILRIGIGSSIQQEPDGFTRTRRTSNT